MRVDDCEAASAGAFWEGSAPQRGSDRDGRAVRGDQEVLACYTLIERDRFDGSPTSPRSWATPAPDTLSHDWCVDLRPAADYTTAVYVSGLLTGSAQAITRSSVVRIVVRNTALRSQ